MNGLVSKEKNNYLKTDATFTTLTLDTDVYTGLDSIAFTVSLFISAETYFFLLGRK